MTPGRELDALVAEKVMGCRVLWQRATVTGPYCGCKCVDFFEEGPHSDPNRMDENLKAYSTDIAAAWEVVEKLQSDKWVFQIMSPYCNTIPGTWTAFFGWKHVDEYEFVTACNTSTTQTAPHAICLAALKALKS